MKPIVVYSSRGGNTQKVADAIASELKCQAVKVTKSNSKDVPDLNNFDLIFIGTGIRYDNPNEDLIAYLSAVNLSAPKRFFPFITWGGAGETNQHALGKLKAALESRGQKVEEKPLFCYGGWNFLKRGHPNAEDLRSAKEWAKRIVQS